MPNDPIPPPTAHKPYVDVADVRRRLFDPLTPQITVTKIKEFPAMSEETIAYRATVTFNGHTFEASNHGQGAPDSFSAPHSVIKAADEFARAFCPYEHDGLSWVVTDAVGKHRIRTTIKRYAKRSVCFVLPEDGLAPGQFRRLPHPATNDHVLEQFPNAIILNDLIK